MTRLLLLLTLDWTRWVRGEPFSPALYIEFERGFPDLERRDILDRFNRVLREFSGEIVRPVQCEVFAPALTRRGFTVIDYGRRLLEEIRMETDLYARFEVEILCEDRFRKSISDQGRISDPRA